MTKLYYFTSQINCHSHNLSPRAQIQQARVGQAAVSKKQNKERHKAARVKHFLLRNQ